MRVGVIGAGPSGLCVIKELLDEGHQVVCVGLGESGADIAHEIANVANSCLLSIRHYHYIIKRYVNGHTNDTYTSRANHSVSIHFLNKILFKRDERLIKKLKKKKVLSLNEKIDMIISGWKTKEKGSYNQFFTKNEVFVKDIAEDRLRVNVGGIERLEGNQVIFKDGTTFEANVIMCCTGYQDRFSFLEHLVKINNVRDMFKHMIHPDLGPRVAFIGWARPATGRIPACSEMQSRYFALLCSGKRQLPTIKDMETRIQKDKLEEEKRFFITPNVHSLVSWSHYMDSLAELIGCKPKIISWNPYLSYKLWAGSQVSYQYRLRGPHAKSDVSKKIIKELHVGIPIKHVILLLLYAIFVKIKLFFKSDKPHI